MSKKSHIPDKTWEIFIINTVNDFKEIKKAVPSRNFLISQLKELYKEKYHKKLPVSDSTIIRFMNKNNFYRNSKFSYGFDNPITYFNSLVSYLGFKEHICFSLNDPSLGTFFAKSINEHYSPRKADLEEYVHCVALQDLLVCFYNESQSKNITAKTLSRDIPIILSKSYYSKNV